MGNSSSQSTPSPKKEKKRGTLSSFDGRHRLHTITPMRVDLEQGITISNNISLISEEDEDDVKDLVQSSDVAIPTLLLERPLPPVPPADIEPVFKRRAFGTITLSVYLMTYMCTLVLRIAPHYFTNKASELIQELHETATPQTLQDETTFPPSHRSWFDFSAIFGSLEIKYYPLLWSSITCHLLQMCTLVAFILSPWFLMYKTGSATAKIFLLLDLFNASCLLFSLNIVDWPIMYVQNWPLLVWTLVIVALGFATTLLMVVGVSKGREMRIKGLGKVFLPFERLNTYLTHARYDSNLSRHHRATSIKPSDLSNPLITQQRYHKRLGSTTSMLDSNKQSRH